MGKKLKNLRWKPMWVSHLGCIKGCLQHLNIDVSDAWLFGATGHAFIINVDEVVCPSGPTAWRYGMLLILGKNLGYNIDGLSLPPKQVSAEKQKLAWEMVKQAIDAGYPCYGWGFQAPEWYVVYGYDDVGYYFSGPECEGDFSPPSGKGPKPWQEPLLFGSLDMYCVKPGRSADDIATIKEAFRFVLEHSSLISGDGCKSGLAGFDNWINALEIGKADRFGVAYNAAVWSECRNLAVGFLEEAKERTGEELSSLFDEAIEHYEVVAQNLRSVSGIFPFKRPSIKNDVLTPANDEEFVEVKDTARCTTAIEHLRKAKKAEESGLKTLEKILEKL